MLKNDLIEIIRNMNLKEKVGQLLQLSGAYYNKEGVVTGPGMYLGVSEEEVRNSGSALNVIGASELIQIQKEYLEKGTHRIPLLFMADIINGFKTIFPIPLGMACSFSPELLEECASVAAMEAGVAGIHITFSPMVDLVRDPRWGRVMETTGEDSLLNSIYARAMVRGYQGNSLLEEGTIAACVKHFAAYGAPTGGRDYNAVDMSERALRQDYLPAYKAAVDEGCALVMASFNTVNGIPATSNQWLMRDILRQEWDFEGVLISDYGAIAELIAHGFSESGKEAAQAAMEAGIDIDMMSSVYVENLKGLVEESKLSEQLIDDAVLRILELKDKLGLFEKPYRFADSKKEKEVILCKKHRDLARKAVTESIVLLKNDGVLPLSKTYKKVAFIGPYVESLATSGAWSIFGNEKDVVSLKQAVLNRQDRPEVCFETGCKLLKDDTWFASSNQWDEETEKQHLNAAYELAKSSDVVVLALGEHNHQSGEGSSRADITLPKVQLDLFRHICELNENVVVILYNGRPLDILELKKNASAIVEAWFPGTEGGNGIVDVLFGDVNPSGRLSMSFPYCVGQIPVYYNGYKTGRPASEDQNHNRFSSKYLDIPNAPLYPFGYGLSYTTFAYSDITLDQLILTKDTSIRASLKVTNTGDYEGIETVQLYIQDVTGSVVRPVKELKGFLKVALYLGETKEVMFVIEEEMLRFYTADMKYASEYGVFKVFIGPDSSVQKYIRFELVGVSKPN